MHWTDLKKIEKDCNCEIFKLVTEGVICSLQVAGQNLKSVRPFESRRKVLTFFGGLW